MNRRRNPITRLAPLVVATAGLDIARAEDGPAVHLDEITVTARPPGSQRVEDISRPVGILSGQELERRQAATLGETLDREPGVTGSFFGPGSSRPIIRGQGGPRVRVLRDGIGTLDVSTISVDHQTSIEPFQAEQIEVLRGPATLLYGSGASGGLVNVATPRIPETVPGFDVDLHARHDSASEGEVAGIRARGGNGPVALHFDGLVRDAEDYEAERGTVENSFVETEDANVGVSWVGNRGFIGISYGRYQSEYGIPIDPDEPDERPFIDLEQDRLDMAGRLESPISGLRSVDFRLGYNDYEHTEFEAPGEPGTEFDNEAVETRLAFNHDTIGGFTGTFGIQHLYRDFAAVGEEAFVLPAEQQSTGLFALEQRNLGDWSIEFGARAEHQTIDPDGSAGVDDIDHDVISLSGGAVWRFTPGYALSINVSRNERAPAIEELLADGPHLATGTFEIGDPGLDEETSSNIDLGLRKTGGRLSWQGNLFVNHIEDFVFLAEQDRNGDGVADEVDDQGNPGGELLLVEVAQDDALFYGMEAEVGYTLFDDPRGTLDLRASGDWVRAEFDDDENLPRISPARLGAGLDYERGRIRADIEGFRVFEQDDTAALETSTDGYTMINAGFAYTLASAPAETRLFIRGTNLLDEDARRHNSFIKDRAPLPGRSAIVGFDIDF